jgi:RNA-directed DNA polymerase
VTASTYLKRAFTENSIKRYYYEKVVHKASPGIDRINRISFEARIDEYVKIISVKVMDGTYKFIPYKEKLISKGAGKFPRQISVPAIRDKLTLSLLNNCLTKTFEDLVNRKIIQTLVDELKFSINTGKYDCFIKLDIRDFYPSIDHDILLKTLKKKIRKASFLSLIEKALCTPTVPIPTKEYELNKSGIPQGIAIASILANIYLSKIDENYSRDNEDFKYFRYVDDILILCNKSNVSTIKDGFLNELKKLHLETNIAKDKVGTIQEGFSYLGYSYEKIKNHFGFSIRKESIKRFEESIIKIFSEYKFHNKTKTDKFIWKLNKKITGCIFEKKKYGWLFFYSQIDNMQLLYHMDWFVQKLCEQIKVDPIIRRRIKRFVRTFHEITFNLSNTNYIPNLDTMDLKEKRAVLRDVFEVRDVNNYTKEEVEIRFKKTVFKFIKELEKDVQNLS